MKIELMRKVDYWAGIPLTAALTGWCRLAGIFHPLPTPERVRKVLFIELSEMGTAVIVDPILKNVGKTRELYFLIFRRNAASLRIYNTVPPEQVFTLRDHSFFAFAWDTVRFALWCRRNGIEAVVDLELFSRVTAILTAISGAPVRIGFYNPHSEGLYRGHIPTHPVTYNPHLHIVENFAALCDPLLQPGAHRDAYPRRRIEDSELRPAQVRPSTAALARVTEDLRRAIPDHKLAPRILLVNINAGDFLPQRKWPKSHFSELVHLFLERNQTALVLLTGSPQERTSVDEVAAAVRSPRCVNIAGDIAFDDLTALYALADALLTNDSGPAHFASAVGLRTYVLFGPETPELYGPRVNSVPIYAQLACSPCVTAANHRNTACRDNQCLQVIAPAFVAEQIQEYFDQRVKSAAN